MLMEPNVSIVEEPPRAASREPARDRELTQAQRVRSIVAGSAGNLVEWYDFYVYAFTALYFAASFFPTGDRTAQLLNVAGVYAAGFLIRPIGGWYFGRLADRRGRRASMIVSVLLMGAGSLMIAVLPTYASIGAAAPALLLVARLIQGFSLGGEYGAAATYLSEVATDARRGFYASFQYVTLIGGQLSALAVLLVVQGFLDDATIRAWGWRLMFGIGAVVALAVMRLRGSMHETVDVATRSDAGSIVELARHWRAFFVVLLVTAGGSLTLYTFTTYMQKFLVNTAGMDVKVVSFVMTAAIVFFMLLQPVIGALSDRIGRRKCLLLFSGVMMVGAVPLLTALSTVRRPAEALALVALGMLILTFYTSISGLFKAELFPQHVRALGVALGHSVSAAVFGGSAEYIALWFKQAGHEPRFFWYVALMCACAFVTALFMREPRRVTMRT
jgi:MFS family permease